MELGFLAGSLLDAGTPEQVDEAAAAYRRALDEDPHLVAALRAVEVEGRVRGQEEQARVLDASLGPPVDGGPGLVEAMPDMAVELGVLLLRDLAVLSFFASTFLMVAAHSSLYVYYSLYLSDIGYSKTVIGLMWSLGVVAEIVFFFYQALPPKLILAKTISHPKWLYWGVFAKE